MRMMEDSSKPSINKNVFNPQGILVIKSLFLSFRASNKSMFHFSVYIIGFPDHSSLKFPKFHHKMIALIFTNSACQNDGEDL